MTDELARTKRPWWRKKRWITAGLLWLVLGYLLSEGPAYYAVVRGWVPLQYVSPLYRPLWLTHGRLPFLANAIMAHKSWWNDLAVKHRPQVMGMSGNGWEITLSTDVDSQGGGVTHTSRDEQQTFTVRFGGHELAVEDGHRISAQIIDWNGPVTFDGQVIAKLPKGTRYLSIEYFDGQFEIEADGVAVEVIE